MRRVKQSLERPTQTSQAVQSTHKHTHTHTDTHRHTLRPESLLHTCARTQRHTFHWRHCNAAFLFLSVFVFISSLAFSTSCYMFVCVCRLLWWSPPPARARQQNRLAAQNAGTQRRNLVRFVLYDLPALLEHGFLLLELGDGVMRVGVRLLFMCLYVCVCVCVLSVSISISVSVPSLSPSLRPSFTSASFFFDLPKRCILEETGRYPALPDAPLTQLLPRPTRPAHCHSRSVNVARLRPCPVLGVQNNCRAPAAELANEVN